MAKKTKSNVLDENKILSIRDVMIGNSNSNNQETRMITKKEMECENNDMKIKPQNKYIDYIQQIKSPQWQKKRLKIMERDGFVCTSCGNEENTLNVHHCVPYRKNTKIWEYEDDELITLCEECHLYISTVVKECNKDVMQICKNIDSACEFLKLSSLLSEMDPFDLQYISRYIMFIKEHGVLFI